MPITMNKLDAVVSIIMLVFLLRGIWVGFIRQIAFIAALMFGFIAPAVSTTVRSPT